MKKLKIRQMDDLRQIHSWSKINILDLQPAQMLFRENKSPDNTTISLFSRGTPKS